MVVVMVTVLWSQQPGRCLVTLDSDPDVCSQCIQLNAKYLVLLSVAIPMATRAIIGPLTFYPTFVATEAFKVARIIQQIVAIAYQLDQLETFSR